MCGSGGAVARRTAAAASGHRAPHTAVARESIPPSSDNKTHAHTHPHDTKLKKSHGLQAGRGDFTAVLGLTFATQSQPLVLIALGVGVTLSNNLLSYAYHAYQAELYPTRIRSAAVGFVYAWSRLATVFSSFIIAALLGAFGAPGVFAFIAAAMAVVVLSVGLLGPRTSGRSLEALSE